MLIYHGLIFIFNKRWIWKVLEWWWIFRAKIYNKMLCMLQWNTRLLKTEITVFHVTFVEANEQKPTRGGATSPPKRVWMGWWWDYRYLWEIFLEWVPQWQQFDPGRAQTRPTSGPKLRSNDRDNNLTVTQHSSPPWCWLGLVSVVYAPQCSQPGCHSASLPGLASHNISPDFLVPTAHTPCRSDG